MFESTISAGATEKLPCSEKLSISSWFYDMEGHAKKCVQRHCELTNKMIQQPTKYQLFCIDDHHFEEEEVKFVGELSKVCSEMLTLGMCWTTRCSMVREQTCTIDHKMDQSL